MLTLWRRHTRKCPNRAKGRAWTKCACPVWVDGDVNGARIRQSCDTRDWARAGRIAARIEDTALSGRTRKRVSEAAAAFIAQCDAEDSTVRKYTGVLKAFLKYTDSIGVVYVDDVAVHNLDGLREARGVCSLTWSKELQILRQFLGFCLDRKWTAENRRASSRCLPIPSRPSERPTPATNSRG